MKNNLNKKKLALCFLVLGSSSAFAGVMFNDDYTVRVCNYTGDDKGRNTYPLKITVGGKVNVLSQGECYSVDFDFNSGAKLCSDSSKCPAHNEFKVEPQNQVGLPTVDAFTIDVAHIWGQGGSSYKAVSRTNYFAAIKEGGGIPNGWTVAMNIQDLEHPGRSGVFKTLRHVDAVSSYEYGDNPGRYISDLDPISKASFSEKKDYDECFLAKTDVYAGAHIDPGGIDPLWPNDARTRITFTIRDNFNVEDFKSNKIGYCQNNRIVGGDWFKKCDTDSAVTTNGHRITAMCKNSLDQDVKSVLDVNSCASHKATVKANGLLACQN